MILTIPRTTHNTPLEITMPDDMPTSQIDMGVLIYLFNNRTHGRGLTLPGVNWKGQNLNWLQFDSCKFNRANFVDVTFGVVFGSSFQGSRMDNLRCNIRATRTSFKDCSLAGANFDAANLELASFHNAELTGASFREARLYSADFLNASGLKRDMFEGASVQDSRFPITPEFTSEEGRAWLSERSSYTG